jgi:predicted nucleic acid-binding protein
MKRRSEVLALDALIAATALHHNLTVATRNTKDFEPFGVLVTNPFTARR